MLWLHHSDEVPTHSDVLLLRRKAKHQHRSCWPHHAPHNGKYHYQKQKRHAMRTVFVLRRVDKKDAILKMAKSLVL